MENWKFSVSSLYSTALPLKAAGRLANSVYFWDEVFSHAVFFTAYGAMSLALVWSQVRNPLAGLLPGTSLNAANVGRTQLMRPYPQFTGITETNIPVGQSWYNAVQVRVDKRFVFDDENARHASGSVVAAVCRVAQSRVSLR